MMSISTFSPKSSSILKQFRRFYSVGVVPIGAGQTLAVKARIDEKRSQAKLGGGIKRIETQHKKVNNREKRGQYCSCS